jgi:hypothetical protein
MSNCSCGGRLGATGVDNCVILFGTTHNYILVPTFKTDGSRNFIDLSSATLTADIQAMVSINTPMLERLYPIPFAENITREKTERILETAPSGNIYNVQDGLRQNMMELYGDNGTIRGLAELEKFGCTQMSYYTVDINGTLEGILEEDGATEFYPMPIMANSYHAQFTYATDTTINKVMLSFNLQRNFDETTIYYLTKADLGFDATQLQGLIPAFMTVSDITTTGVTAKVLKRNGSALTERPITGLLLADFDLYDLTGEASVTITGVTESTEFPGTYVITYSAVTGANSFELSATVEGFDIESEVYADPA